MPRRDYNHYNGPIMKPSEIFETPEASGFDRTTHNTREQIYNLVKEVHIQKPFEDVTGEPHYVTDEVMKILHQELQKAREEERERIEAIFKELVPPHAMDLEDSVWLKRLLNKAFNHDKNI